MSTLSRLFGSGPTALEVSDWLANMNDAFLAMAQREIDQRKSSPDMLVLFTLANASLSTNNVLHQSPAILPSICRVYAELRAYYECLWQLALLNRYPSPEEGQRIGKLYANTQIRTGIIIEQLFSKNRKIKELLSRAFDDSYDNRLREVIPVYISGRYGSDVTPTGNMLNDNVEAVTGAVVRVAHMGDSARSQTSAIIKRDTDQAMKLVLLTRFELHSCPVLEFPSSWYR